MRFAEKNGGSFRNKNYDEWWYVAETGTVKNVNNNSLFNLRSFDFSSTWIYEPQKSVFQEWEEEQVHILDDTKIRELRKEGFNFALDYLINSNIGISQQTKQEIEKLKEK